MKRTDLDNACINKGVSVILFNGKGFDENAFKVSSNFTIFLINSKRVKVRFTP